MFYEFTKRVLTKDHIYLLRPKIYFQLALTITFLFSVSFQGQIMLERDNYCGYYFEIHGHNLYPEVK